MVEEVAGHKLYQVTSSASYKQAFSLGQKVSVGGQHNPFFSFYETTREYPVMDSTMGATIQVNAVEWLYRVRSAQSGRRRSSLPASHGRLASTT